MTESEGSSEPDATSRGTGVVLAGGRSTRFRGGDKALARVDGVPMVARVVEAVAAVSASVVVNCRADQRAAFEDALDAVDAGVRFAVDGRPDEGPLVGLDRALSAVDATPVFVVACDLPFLDAGLLSSLAERLNRRADDAPDAVLPVDAGGHPTPTCGVYRREPLRDAVASALADGDRSLRAGLEPLTVETVPPSAFDAPARAVADVDTREDLRALAPTTDGDDQRDDQRREQRDAESSDQDDADH